MADELDRGYQQLDRGSQSDLRAAPGEDHIGRSKVEPAGHLNQPHGRRGIDDRPCGEPVHGRARMRQSRRDGTAAGRHRQMHIPARGKQCLGGQFNLPACTDGVESPCDHQEATTIGSHIGCGSVRTRLVL
jgi:hypothetical protein